MPIKIPSGEEVRPSKSKVRQAILNILQTRLESASIWDLCAGSGALGLEAVSRGAQSCVFVEKSAKVFSVLSDNCEELRRRFLAQKLALPDLTLINNDLSKVDLATLPKPNFILIDPPYAEVENLMRKFLPSLMKSCLEDVVLCLECGKQTANTSIEKLGAEFGWTVIKDKNYGESKLFMLATI